MKRIISLLLAFVLVLSFSISSFAVTSDEQADDLTSGWGYVSSAPSYPSGYYQSWYYLMLYHTYQIRQNVNSIKTDTGNIYDRLGFIYTSVSNLLSNSNSIESDVDSIRSSVVSLVGHLDGVESYLQDINTDTGNIDVSLNNVESDIDLISAYLLNTLNARLTEFSGYLNLMTDDVSMLQQVLADQDDLDLKNSQKENQEFIENEFFTPGSDLSVDTDKLGDLVSYSDSFTSFFDFSKYGGGSPLDQIGEGSPFTQWFSEDTGKSMDPTFVASSAPDDFPWPEPDDPDDPDDPDNPDVPEPEVTATPSISYSESTFTVSASGNGTVLMYVDGSQVSNPYVFTQTSSAQTFVVTATAQESGKLISETARVEITVPAYVPPEPEVTATPTISYSESTFTVSAAGNGTVLMYVDGSQVSNPYVFTQTSSAQTFVVTATAQESGKLISETARVEITVPAYVPPEPEVTATPSITYSESTFTVSASGNGTVLMYVNGSQVSNPYTFTQTYDVQTFTVTATAQEDGKEISATASLNVSVPAMPRPQAPTPTLTYDEDSLTVTASLSNPPSGVVIFLFIDGVSSSNPHSFTQTTSVQTFVVTAYSSGAGYLKSDTATLTVTVPAEVPSWTPPTNYIPISTTNANGSGGIYNGTGYRVGYSYNSTNEFPTLSSIAGFGCTGWIEIPLNATVYFYNVDFRRDNGSLTARTYNGSSYGTVVYSKYNTTNQFIADANGVCSWVNSSGATKLAFNLLNLNSSSVISINAYPLETQPSSTFSLRGPSVTPYDGSQIVTSFYQSRQNVFEFLLKGRWFK